MIEESSYTADQAAFAATAEKCFAACDGLDIRGIADELCKTGLLGVMAASAGGGLGLGAADALPVVEAAGARLLAYPIAEGIAAAWCRAELADGKRIVTACWSPEVGVEQRSATWRLSGIAPRVANALLADALIFGTVDGIFFIDLTAPGITVIPAIELDLERPFGDVMMADVQATLLGNASESRAFNQLGTILRSADMLGAAQEAFSSACAYTSTRKQFGKALSALQVVRTDLARDYYRLECARASGAYAASAWDARQEDVEDACAVAANVASSELPTVAENAIQLHGAMGFTWEMPQHRWLRRIRTASETAPPYLARQGLTDRLLQRWSKEY